MLRKVRYRAKRTGRTCTLREQDLTIPETCPVLGIPLQVQRGRQTANSPSVDRLDNTRGYEPDNVRVISHRANELKRDGTLQEFEALVTWLRKEHSLL